MPFSTQMGGWWRMLLTSLSTWARTFVGITACNMALTRDRVASMQDAVRLQMKWWKGDLKEGDVLVSNHPQLAGGSHLPDITVMTPVFHDGHIVFFVARYLVLRRLCAPP
mgnify:CR=1 FL=1